MKKPKKSILETHTDIAKQWHPLKNIDLKPSQVTYGSKKKVWWVCESGHEWLATVNSRSSGTGCPYCAGKLVTEDNSLAKKNPELIPEWHLEKNNKFTPWNVTPGSNKKVWWICEQGHEWLAQVHHRSNGIGCPYCSGRYATEENNLNVKSPDIADSWHPTRNGDLKPQDVTPHSHKKVWWICDKGHEWKARIISRSAGTGCPFCYGIRVATETYPLAEDEYLMSQWNDIRNVGLNPEKFTSGSSKKVWWRCQHGHEWKTAIHSRSKGSGCPFCSWQTSKPEIRIYTELKKLFDPVKWRAKINGIEIDVYIPELKVGIEYDGFRWHRKKLAADTKKNKRFDSMGITIFRVREPGLSRVTERDILCKKSERILSIIKRLLRQLMKFNVLLEKNIVRIEPYLNSKKLQNDKEFRRILSYLPGPEPGSSFADKYQKLSKDWNQEKNAPLKPTMFTPKSGKKVWWKCNKDHEWVATIGSRASGRGCPYCSGYIACEDNNFAVNHPKISLQWDQDKNKGLSSKEVTSMSKKKAWWICEKGHSYQAVIRNRANGSGCPYCAGKRVGYGNSLADNNPDLAKQWCMKNNGKLTPYDFTKSSGKMVWWRCEKGHKWRAKISDRNIKNAGCPYCSGNKAGADNTLAVLQPVLAKQWSKKRNGNLTPNDVTPGSNKKVWWECEKGHEWETSVYERYRGSGCPFCKGRKASPENCLSIKFPEIAAEWHPKKNRYLGPEMVTHGSKKKVWWKCKEGHEWLDTINHRTSGRNCPKCKL